MTQATICIPSHRSLEKSMEPLWSAIDYAQKCGFAVVISDNSGDLEKRSYFMNGPIHLTYLADGPAGALDNVMAALSAVETEFVMMLGDDDFIALAEGGKPFDFSALDAGFVGVKPRIELVGATGVVSAVNDFTIDSDDAASRVLEYTRKSQGGNSTYYSFFRTAVLKDINTLLSAHHPTGVGNADFPVVYALAAAGRIAHDPATVLRYDNSRWDDPEAANAAMLELFESAGLPPEALSYMLLLHFMDSFVLMLRNTSSLELIDRYKSAYAVVMVFAKKFLVRVVQSPAEYAAISELVAPFNEEVENADPDLDRIFHIAGLMVDRVKPGLKAQYDSYLLMAARGVQS